MYFDTKPCAVCGSEVELRPRESPPQEAPEGAVGQPDGVVGDADSTVDERVCTNPSCPTHQGEQTA
jgi:hypothetical protein